MTLPCCSTNQKFFCTVLRVVVPVPTLRTSWVENTPRTCVLPLAAGAAPGAGAVAAGLGADVGSDAAMISSSAEFRPEKAGRKACNVRPERGCGQGPYAGAPPGPEGCCPVKSVAARRMASAMSCAV